MPKDFSNFSSLIVLNLAGNNFVSTPSCISKLPKLEYLGLNWCEMLQKLPEFQSSMRMLNASNCTSFECSKSNLSRPCSLFASHPRHTENYQQYWRVFWKFAPCFPNLVKIMWLVYACTCVYVRTIILLSCHLEPV